MLRTLLLSLLCAGTALATDAPPTGGKRLAPFTLKASGGAVYDVGQHLGKDVVVLAFWATWCKPCKLELAAVNKLYLKYKDQGLVLLALSTDGPDSVAEVIGYKKKFGYEFPVLMDSETAVLERYNPRGDIPFSMVIDRHGRIVETHQGFNPGDEIPLEAHLKELLAEAPPDLALTAEGAAVDPPLAYWVKPANPRLEGTESLRVSYLVDNFNGNDNDDNVLSIVNRLTVGGAMGPLSLGVRADNVAYPGYRPTERCVGVNELNCQWRDDHRVEKLWLQYKTHGLHLRGGDYYHSMGRGLVFSVRKIDELGVDTTIRGGKATGTIGPVTLRGFGGQANISNVDTLEEGALQEVQDVMAGGEVALELPYKMQVAARGVWIDYYEEGGDDAPNDRGDWAVGGSLAVNGLADMITIYFEGLFHRNEDFSNLIDTDLSADGHALYGSVSIQPAKGLSLLLEGKDYRRFEMAHPDGGAKNLGGVGKVPVVYHEAPTLERYDQITFTNPNSTGFRLLVEYVIGLSDDIKMLVYGNAVVYGTSDNADFAFDEVVDNFGKDSDLVAHAYGGFELRFESGTLVAVSAGWRTENRNTTSPGQSEFKRRLWHIESDFQFPLFGKHSLGFRTNHRTEEKVLGSKVKEFHRGDVALTYGYAPQLTVGLLWTYQTEFPQEPEFFNVAAEVGWKFADWGQWSVYGGRNTGGLICINGICRQLPPFFGVRTDFIARF